MLHYITIICFSEGGDTLEARPVIIHRAILGSVERMMAILTELYAGKWPFWLSPRQIMIIPVAEPFNNYATEVQNTFYKAGFHVDAELSSNTLNKKIRSAQVAQYNFIFGKNLKTNRVRRSGSAVRVQG